LTGCYDAGDVDDCLGNSCPFFGFQKPWAGELNIEYIAQVDGTDLTRVSAHFVESQTPEYLPMMQAGACTNFFATTAWPLGQADERVYMDVGESITVSTGDISWEVPRELAAEEPVTDYLFRTHDIAYLMRNPPGMAPEGMFDAHWSVTIDEDINFAPLLKDVIYMAPRYEVLSPTEFTHSFDPNQDYEIKWKMLGEVDPGPVIGVIFIIVSLDGSNLAGITGCLGLNTGTMVIPKEVIEGLPTQNGLLQFGLATDEPILTPDGRLIHLMGQNCVQRLWQKTE
jgi:hypothetical protein